MTRGNTYSCTYDYRIPNSALVPDSIAAQMDSIAAQMNEHDWSQTGQLNIDECGTAGDRVAAKRVMRRLDSAA